MRERHEGEACAGAATEEERANSRYRHIFDFPVGGVYPLGHTQIPCAFGASGEV